MTFKGRTLGSLPPNPRLQTLFPGLSPVSGAASRHARTWTSARRRPIPPPTSHRNGRSGGDGGGRPRCRCPVAPAPQSAHRMARAPPPRAPGPPGPRPPPDGRATRASGRAPGAPTSAVSSVCPPVLWFGRLERRGGGCGGTAQGQGLSGPRPKAMREGLSERTSGRGAAGGRT